MPEKKLHRCNKLNCNEFTRDRYCEQHMLEYQKKQNYYRQKRYDSKRPSAAKRGYGHNWRQVRECKLKNNPVCELCNEVGIVSCATVVHHIDENSRNNIDTNLMSLCRNCHEKTHGRMS